MSESQLLCLSILHSQYQCLEEINEPTELHYIDIEFVINNM